MPGPKKGAPQSKRANVEPKKAPDRAKLLKSLEEYVQNTEIPIFKEWCSFNGLLAQTVMAWPEFKELHDLCIGKKEAGLERASLNGAVNNTQAIFSLKQLGWRDKQEVDLNVPQPISVNFTENVDKS